MPQRAGPDPRPRTALSRDRVLRAAVTVADEGSIEAVTMRRLAQVLGVEAMSLYNHVSNKENLLDGMVDVLVTDIELSAPTAAWRTAIRRQAMSARDVLRRHPWAPPVIVSRRTISPAMLTYMDSVMGTLLRGGMSRDLAHNSMHVLGSRVLGFTQELFDPRNLGPEVEGITSQPLGDRYPSIADVLSEITHDDDIEFEFGLELILDGIERARVTP